MAQLRAFMRKEQKCHCYWEGRTTQHIYIYISRYLSRLDDSSINEKNHSKEFSIKYHDAFKESSSDWSQSHASWSLIFYTSMSCPSRVELWCPVQKIPAPANSLSSNSTSLLFKRERTRLPPKHLKLPTELYVDGVHQNNNINNQQPQPQPMRMRVVGVRFAKFPWYAHASTIPFAHHVLDLMERFARTPAPGG